MYPCLFPVPIVPSLPQIRKKDDERIKRRWLETTSSFTKWLLQRNHHVFPRIPRFPKGPRWKTCSTTIPSVLHVWNFSTPPHYLLGSSLPTICLRGLLH